MIFNDSLYSIPFRENMMIQMDLTNRTFTENKIDVDYEIRPISACNDNNGNIFIYDIENKRFIKYDVETKQSILFLIVSSISSYIYSLIGVDSGNFKYSIEDNQWETFFRDDKLEREYCGCAVRFKVEETGENDKTFFDRIVSSFAQILPTFSPVSSTLNLTAPFDQSSLWTPWYRINISLVRTIIKQQ
ncbi:hypothetical protein PPL_08277 [Heterostelium album PN500]|uniref:Uncharacterized protein n=1 Tax=Heterostelium pallidum (strain ATCC 26659 / Pp 5 / PN500) TaxID=670386 RepID=D3BHR3_HETP5|nr:hypothetical protein PPL_08277 [Heterostelium album PN500]EFA78813.1 hypothetical protein PPL_08277 [Heterostelium album PN500]|eukprot:XP_020430937.1 hypothetical protein PPL_08277 [Heterostelium album PN500]